MKPSRLNIAAVPLASRRPRIAVPAPPVGRRQRLLFVPAGVGIVVAAASGSGHWLAICAAVVGSTLLTLAATALVLQALTPADRRGGDGDARTPARQRDGGDV
ncbi:CidA/LrgA family protein [Massilia phosphatilytica]